MLQSIVAKRINEEKSVLIIEKTKNKIGDYSQIYYDGAIKCLEDFPVKENIIAYNTYLKEKRVESKIHIDSEYYQGVSEALDILTDILDEVLYEI